MTTPYCPHYPRPQAERPSAWRMFFSKRRSWLDALYERSYHMNMGEVHLPGIDLYMVNEPALVRRVMVDEAHATGTVGAEGRGAVAAAGLTSEVDVIVGTLSKALGSYGAFAACDTQLARFLVNSARSFIYSTAPAPPVVAAAAEALEILI